ncbi:nicotinate phosphoribosyltransferase [Geopseudomonas aromaticivorans]
MESAYGENIIQNLLDTDYYTFTMQQAILHQHPNVDVEYDFIVRSDENLVQYIPEVRQEIERLCDMSMTDDQLRFLGDPTKRGYIKPDYIEFMRLFRLNLRYVHVFEREGQMAVRVRGSWVHTIPFEQPILAMVSEIRNRHVYPNVTLDDVRERLYAKFDNIRCKTTSDELKYLKVADFGTRRRLSFLAQKEMVHVMSREFPGVFVGTSNVHLGREFNLPVIGTMAHQWLMAHQQLGRLRESQSAALDNWVKEYRGELGIALTDTISSDFFLSEFDSYFAKLFDGPRQDSADPFEWGEKFIAHYKKLRIDPLTKTFVFSDSLKIDEICIDLMRHFRDRVGFSFGVGTSQACDVEGVKPLQIVMKLVRVNGQPVVKFSDDPIKNVCEDENFKSYAATTFGVKY